MYSFPRLAAIVHGLIVCFVISIADSALYAQFTMNGYVPVFSGSTNGMVWDFDYFPPRTSGYSEVYGPDLSDSFEEMDIAPVGQNGVKGGAQSVITAYTRLNQGSNGYILVNSVTATSKVMNESSDPQTSFGLVHDVNTDVLGQANLELNGTGILAGKTFVYFGRRGLQPSWGFAQNYEGSGSISMPGGNINAQTFSSPAGPPPPSEGANAQVVSESPIYHVFDTMGLQRTLNLSLNTRARLLDGAMDPLGDLPPEQWPSGYASAFTYLHIIDPWVGGTSTPIQPFLNQPLGMGIPVLSPPEQRLMPGSLEFAQFPFFPTGKYYELPFFDLSEIGFSTLDNTLFTSLGDLIGFDGQVQLFANGMDLGFFSNGDFVDFELLMGSGVSSFTLIDPGNSFTDHAGLMFNFNDSTAFVYSSRPSPVPEPIGGVLVALSLCFVGRFRPKREKA